MLRIKLVIITILFSILLPLEGQLVLAAEGDDENKTVYEEFEESPEVNENEEESPINEPVEQPVEEQLANNQFTFFDFLNLIFALFLVLMLLYVTLRFIKKKNQTYDSTKTMANLGGTSLGNNRSVQLVKVGDRILIVGVGENIQLLKEIDSEEEINRILSQQQQDVQQLLQPGDILTKIMDQFKSSKQKEKQENQNQSFKSVLASQLSELSKGRKKLLDELDEKGKKSDD
ncbi:flagellar biosynthetic protein FliO [Bacillus sp. AK128]